MKKTCQWMPNFFPALMVAALAWICVGVPGPVVAAGPDKAVPKASPTLPQGLENPQLMKTAAEIEALTLGTETDGGWTYVSEVKNTGVVTFDLREARFKAWQIMDNHQEVLIHEVNTGMKLAPGGVITSKEPWNRCSNASGFRFEFWYQGKKLDSRTIPVPPLQVDILKAVLNQNQQTWFADIRNPTPFALRISARPFAAKGLNSKGMPPIGTESRQVIPAKSKAKFTGNLKSWAGGPALIRAAYDNPGGCGASAGNILATQEIGAAGVTQPHIFIQSLTWNRASMTWVATVKNNGNSAADIGITGFPLENGQTGMTVWTNLTIAPHGTAQLTGNYANFTVPPGTRLKVHVLLKPSNKKIHEKIIVMD
jgi:hypothetical protein